MDQPVFSRATPGSEAVPSFIVMELGGWTADEANRGESIRHADTS